MLYLLLTVLVFVTIEIYTKHRRHKRLSRMRTASIKIRFGDKHMGAPSSTSVQVGTPEFALIQALQANGSDSNGVVSNITWTIADTTVATVLPNAAGFAEVNGVAAGATTLTVTATVTDPNGTVNTFTAVASVTVTVAVDQTLTTAIETLFTSTNPATPAA